MRSVTSKVIGIFLVFIINSITIFINSDKMIQFIISFIPDGIQVIAMTPIEVLTMTISISALLSFLIVMPLIIYYIVSYMNDALFLHEKRVLKNVLFFGTILFSVGFFIALLVFIRGGLPWLAAFNISHGVETLWSLNDTVYSMLAIGISAGIAFELPMVLYYLIKYRIIEFKMDRANRGITLIVLAIGFAIITPDGSGATQLALMLPVYSLIEVSTFFGNRNKLNNKEVKK